MASLLTSTSDGARHITLSALTFLCALVLRDIATQTWEHITPEDKGSFGTKVLYNSIFFIVVFITVILIVAFWKSNDTFKI
jgi:hypothetical protein